MTGDALPARRSAAEETQAAELRASHADRDRVVELLRVAAGDGRLTPEELDERLEAALSARTVSELAVLTTDLPAAPGEATVQGAPRGTPLAAPQAKDLVRINQRGGNVARAGRWVVPARIEATVSGGNIKLDFTEAVITQPVLQIDADVRGGHMILVTRPGISVDADDLAVSGGNTKFRAGTESQVPVVLRVELSGHIRGGNVTVRPPRRTFWQWLLRRPRPYQA